MTNKQPDTRRQMVTILETMAAHGMTDSKDVATCLRAVAMSHMGEAKTAPAVLEANRTLGIPDTFTSFTDLATKLSAAHDLLPWRDFNRAAATRFGSDGVRFAALAPVIHGALTARDAAPLW